ncbi:MAG: WhiB family transcriptional regulator [Acidimicrobiia bacterium]|nr:WhiB family transcriptional regulator [Acidimicrobiia bacterium]
MRSWRDQAKCRGLDPEIFFPDPEIEEDASEAITICLECRVQEVCLEHALARREKEGVWGGATVKERRRIIRRRRRSA